VGHPGATEAAEAAGAAVHKGVSVDRVSP